MAVPAIRGDVLEELVAGIVDGSDLDIPSDTAQSINDAGDYPPAVRQAAFQLWAYESGESFRHTQRLLKDRTGIDVNIPTLQSWAREGQWTIVKRQLHQTFRSKSRAIVQELLDIGVIRATRWAVAAIGDPNVSDTVKAKLASSFLDRNGFPIMLRGEMVDSLNIPSIGELSSLSDAELEARIYQYSEDAEAILPAEDTDPRFDELQHIERHRVVSHANMTRGKA